MAVKRETLVQAIKTRFAGISAATGYHNTLTGHVEIWDARAADSLRVNIKDGDEEIVSDLASRYWDRRLTVDLEINCDGSTSDTAMRALIEDLWKSIGSDLAWSGSATDTKAISSKIQTDHEENRITGARLQIEILYRTDAWSEDGPT